MKTPECSHKLKPPIIKRVKLELRASKIRARYISLNLLGIILSTAQQLIIYIDISKKKHRSSEQNRKQNRELFVEVEHKIRGKAQG